MPDYDGTGAFRHGRVFDRGTGHCTKTNKPVYLIKNAHLNAKKIETG